MSFSCLLQRGREIKQSDKVSQPWGGMCSLVWGSESWKEGSSSGCCSLSVCVENFEVNYVLLTELVEEPSKLRELSTHVRACTGWTLTAVAAPASVAPTALRDCPLCRAMGPPHPGCGEEEGCSVQRGQQRAEKILDGNMRLLISDLSL